MLNHRHDDDTHHRRHDDAHHHRDDYNQNPTYYRVGGGEMVREESERSTAANQLDNRLVIDNEREGSKHFFNHKHSS